MYFTLFKILCTYIWPQWSYPLYSVSTVLYGGIFMWMAKCTDLQCTLWWLLFMYIYIFILDHFLYVYTLTWWPVRWRVSMFCHPGNFLTPICSCYTSPQEEPWFCHCTLVLPVVELHINRFIQYVLFCVWLFSLHIMVFLFVFVFCFLRFILVACIWILPFSVVK